MSSQFQANQAHSDNRIANQLDEQSRLLIASQAHSNSRITHQLDEQSRMLTAILNTQFESQNPLQLSQPQEQLPRNQSTVPSSVQWPAIHVRTTYVPREDYSSCHLPCPCRCHDFHRFHSPSLLNRLIGALFIGYSGYSGAFSKCTMTSCKGPSNLRVTVYYIFPSWLVRNCLVSICVQKVSRGIMTSLAVRNIVPVSAPIFQFAVSNNVDGLKGLFHSRLARPDDTRTTDGNDALSVSSHSFPAISYLDLCLPFMSYLSPRKYFTVMMLRK